MNDYTTHQGDKVKPTERIMKSASTPKIGLRALAQAQGGGGHMRVLLTISLRALCAIFGSLALFTGIAQAEAPKLISIGNFSPGHYPDGIAVDQSTSDVYVASFFLSNINKFDASGKLLTPPSPFGEGYHSGAAVNPTNGDIYVLDTVEVSEEAYEARIDTYDPSTGALLSSFAVPGSGNYIGLVTVVQIATDSAGDVYVPVTPDNEVQEYSPSGTLLRTFTGLGSDALSGPIGVAVDSAGNVWIADTQKNRIEEFSPTGTVVGEIKSEGVQSVALDTHGDVFAIVSNGADFCGSLAPPCSHLVEYSPAGAQLADIGAGSIGAITGLSLPNMLAVNDSNGRVYVADSGNELVWIYGPPSAPVLGKELAGEVSTSEAKLGALINPDGIETTYRFEYGTTTAYGQTRPFPAGNVGQGFTTRTVWAAAIGLEPGTTYHYRVIAANELGTVVGADQTFTTETAAETSCPNEQLRSGFSASLPDCRAYELVSPPTKTSAEPDHEIADGSDAGDNVAAREGDRMSYTSYSILPGSQTAGESYVSKRAASGWSTENVIPLQSYTGVICNGQGDGAEHEIDVVPAYAADLSKEVVSVGLEDRASVPGSGQAGCNAEGVEVVSGEPLGFENLLLRDNTNDTYQLINPAPPGVTPADAHFQGASSDLSHVIFEEHAQLTVNAPGGADDLYEWSGGAVRLVTVLPNGTPVVGSLPAGLAQTESGNAISADGSHIFFTAGGNLYVRLNGERTVQVDEPRGGSGPGGGGKFQDASADGSRVFFTDEASAGLTGDTLLGSGPNLYEYDLENGVLTDLTPAGKAAVEGIVGISQDGTYAYFLAEGSLAAGATQGQANLYLSHGGSTTLIATLPSGGEDVLGGAARVSPNGAFLAFASHKSLTGYDNTEANSGQAASEIFFYSVASNQLACASCNPSGEAPTTALGATMRVVADGVVPHYLSDSGRLFFDTAEALLPSDTNGQIDVYEYESGQLHLISTGTSASRSELIDASESGNDVFFLTRQELVPQDTEEEALGMYDARVDGGFPAPSSTPPCTTADSCRPAPEPQPSIFGSPSSATFAGTGNLPSPVTAKPKVKPKVKPVKCKKGFMKKKDKCVKKPMRKAKKSAHTDKTGK